MTQEEIIEKALHIFGTKDLLNLWLTKENKELNCKPVTLLNDKYGLRKLEIALNELRRNIIY